MVPILYIRIRLMVTNDPKLGLSCLAMYYFMLVTVYSFVTLFLLQITLNIFKDERSFFMLSLVKNQAWLQDAERQTSVCHRG